MRRTTGISSIDTAKLCFEENLQLFGNAKAQPEKHNLYKGLLKLAETVEAMQMEMHQLRTEVAALQRQLSQRR